MGAKQIIDFIDRGGNVLLAANEKTGSTIQDLLYEFGSVVDEAGFSVYDNFVHNSTFPNVLALDQLEIPISSNKLSAPVLYTGTAIKFKGKNPYSKPLLVAGPAAYSWDNSVVNKAPLVTGKNAVLVNTLQAVNNARIIMSGSIKMFSNE